jgi:hypothetical protein
VGTHWARTPTLLSRPARSPPQVRFGVLNAGNFGVAQSRKRTFIWAAAPGELLPDWPRLMHCFRTPQLTINLPGGVQYCAVPQTVSAVGWQGGLSCKQAGGQASCCGQAVEAGSSGCAARPAQVIPAGFVLSIRTPPSNPIFLCLFSAWQVGAPLRPVTVRDAIGDLPPIENGHMVDEMEYCSGPVGCWRRVHDANCRAARSRRLECLHCKLAGWAAEEESLHLVCPSLLPCAFIFVWLPAAFSTCRCLRSRSTCAARPPCSPSTSPSR